jgi:hypothetical protein
MMGKTVIILVSGKAGTGKSYFAEKLRLAFECKNYNVEVQHFASVLKSIAKQYFWWDGIKDGKGRKLLQHLGDVGREYDKDVWVKNLIELRLLNSPNYPQDVIIIDDWRFPNEYQYLKENLNYSIYTIEMIAPDREILNGEAAKHISEVALEEFNSYNFIIDNSEHSEITEWVREVVTEIVQKEDNFK